MRADVIITGFSASGQMSGTGIGETAARITGRKRTVHSGKHVKTSPFIMTLKCVCVCVCVCMCVHVCV